MNNREFSQEMDVIYENINKGGAVGLDIYEKSVILTNAQEKLVQSLVATSLDALPALVRTTTVPVSTDITSKIDDRSYLFKLPEEFLTIASERAIHHTHANPTLAQKVFFTVMKLNPIEYSSLMMKPYAYPPRRTAWRLVNSGENTSGYFKEVEIISRPGIELHEYRATYIIPPLPIVLEDLTGGDTIRGFSVATETNMIESLHPTILEYAVTLAEQYYYDKYPQEKAKE